MKVGIIGAGSVGSTTAFALIMRGVARKVVLIDANEKKAQAEAMDIAHATPFAYANKVKAGTYEDLKGCEIVIVTAGANQKPGETRIDLLGRNVKIFESIIPQIAQAAPDTTLIITSNPADIMTEVALKLSGFPKERVIGSGTVLDTARFRTRSPFMPMLSANTVTAKCWSGRPEMPARFRSTNWRKNSANLSLRKLKLRSMTASAMPPIRLSTAKGPLSTALPEHCAAFAAPFPTMNMRFSTSRPTMMTSKASKTFAFLCRRYWANAAFITS